jgi:hypothetical protein
MVISLGDFHKIPPEAFETTGALDPILGIDTRLFIDPSLLRHTNVPELAGSFSSLSEHFANTLKVIRFIENEDDAFWRKADDMLTFPEVQGLCIGYSSKGIAGKGMGQQKRRRLLSTMTQLVKAGCEDEAVFELVGAFEENIGPDLISDMTAKIIMADLIAFTQRVCSDLGLPMETLVYSRKKPPEDLPFNPESKAPIILVPKQILRDLPVADSFADIGWIVEHNEKLRDEINSLVAGSYRTATTSNKKNSVREAMLRYPDVLAQIISAYEGADPHFYDFKDDRAGETIWYRASKRLKERNELKLELSKKPSLDEVYAVVEKICEQFKRLIEDNGWARLLYDKNGYRKHESAAQLLFFGVASIYCEANDLDLSPESDGGRGPVDFKVSSGFLGKVLVEIKLSSNKELAHGFMKQLPIYEKAERAQRGIYLVIQNGGITKSRWQGFSDIVQGAGPQSPTVMVVDGTVRPSASKAEF